jgi:alkanesulfonate monooxygenase SsuD/methylene tetrahydromethanopterin reductase-like flavin-dependent oxidoreductase (luciferase family)
MRAVSIPNMGGARDVVDLAVAAEAAGWDGVFLWDHVQWRRAAANDVFDPWVLLGAIARETERVRIGALVTPLARRRPQKLAKEIITVDHLSGGRIVVGVGLGSPDDDEFTAFGDPGDRRRRAELLDEGLEVLDALLRGGPVHHDGPHFHVDAELRPASVQRPRPPIWVAGLWPNPRPFRRAARYDGIAALTEHGATTPDQLRALIAACRAAGAGNGFDVLASDFGSEPVDELIDAGATWIVTSPWPAGDWVPGLRRRIESGPEGSW